MKLGLIDGIEFHELPAEKYWSFPASYKKDSKAETRNMIFSGDYLGARKMDGAYYRFVKDMDGNMVLQGRSRSVSGEFLNKIDWVPHLHNFFNSLPNGTCLLGELYFPTHEGSSEVTKIMGCKTPKAIERQVNDKLHYYIFDVWAFDGISFLEDTFEKRIDQLETLRIYSKPNSLMEDRTDLFPEIDFAIYYEGAQLWNKLQCILEEGGEGVVITKRTSHAEPGKRAARKTLKIKKEIANTIDCIVIGANPPTKEYKGKNLENWEYYIDLKTEENLPIKNHYKEYLDGAPILPVTKNWYMKMAGSLRLGLVKNDKVIYFGDLSGLPYEVLQNWDNYKGKVCEVTAMQITDDHKLRHPKFVCWREDKNPRECLIDQVE